MRLIRKYKYVITLILVFIISIGLIVMKNNLKKQEYDVIIDNEIEKNVDVKEEEKEEMCTVDIKGAVNNPGVYTIDCNKYVYNIIELAHGLTDKADTSNINLAKKITDEMIIVVNTEKEVNEKINTNQECVCSSDFGYLEANNNDSSSQLLNINVATLTELKKLPGIGETKAKAIIKHREVNGNFKNKEDIQKVSGIGAKLYEQIKDYITT